VSRRYRNRRIGEFLKELELTEGRSTGIPKILKAMSANGSPAPLFETDDDRCAYVIRLPVHPLAQQPAGEVIEQVIPQVTPQVIQLLQIIDSELGRGELMTTLGLRDRMHFSNHYLAPALEAGLIEMTIPDKPRSSKQRYRLTAKGRQWLRMQDTGESHE
jgi:ATP-dependent DNA helicase RecG